MPLHTTCAKAALITSVCGMVCLPTLLPPAAATAASAGQVERVPISAAVSSVTMPPVEVSSVSMQRPTAFDDTSEHTSPVTITIDDLSPRILTTESSLTVTVLIANTTGQPVEDATLSVTIQTQTPPSLNELAHYFSGDRWEGQLVYDAPVGASIPARSSLTVKVSIPRDELPFDGDYAWGPRGLAATLTSPTHTAVDRSVVIWDSGVDLTPADANVIIPWTANTAPTSSNERGTIQALTSLSGTTLAVDPTLVTGVPNAPGSATGTQDDDDGQSAAADASSPHAASGRAPSEVLNQFLSSHPVDFFPLFPFDADPALLASVENPHIREAAVTSMEALRESHAHIPHVIWPSEEGFSTSVMRAFPDATIVAPAGRLSTQEELDFTPAAVVAVDRHSGITSVRGHTEDTSTVITHSALVAHLLRWEAFSAGDTLDRDQLLMSAGALFTRERPTVRRSFVSVLPRNQVLTADAVGRVRSLLSPRWVTGRTLKDILMGEATDVPRHLVGDASLPESDRRVGTSIGDSLKRIAPVVSSVVDRPDVYRDVLYETLACMSAGVEPTTRALKAVEFDAYAHTLASGIHAESSATINLINKTANFPVRVTNSLDWDARVTVTLAPSDPRLRVTNAVEAILPAHSTTSVDVPVTAIGAGDIQVNFIVSALDGARIDASQAVEVRLRAGWEDALTATFGGLVAVAFIIGLLRTIRRRMRSHEVPGTGGPILQGMIPVSDHPVNQEDQ